MIHWFRKGRFSLIVATFERGERKEGKVNRDRVTQKETVHSQFFIHQKM